MECFHGFQCAFSTPVRRGLNCSSLCGRCKNYPQCPLHAILSRAAAEDSWILSTFGLVLCKFEVILILRLPLPLFVNSHLLPGLAWLKLMSRLLQDFGVCLGANLLDQSGCVLGAFVLILHGGFSLLMLSASPFGKVSLSCLNAGLCVRADFCSLQASLPRLWGSC